MERRGRFKYHLRGRSHEVSIVCRFTVSSAVSPVGQNLVGIGSAERERVSPQRARFEGAVRVCRASPRLSSRCPNRSRFDL